MPDRTEPDRTDPDRTEPTQPDPTPEHDEEWARAVASGSPSAIVGELIGAVGRSTEAVASGFVRFARHALAEYRGAFLDPVLERLRAGTSLREDLISLLRELAGDRPPDDENTAGPDASDAPVATDEQVSQIEAAIATGVDHAVATGAVTLDHDTDVVAWALTSLITTLAMRAREGDDTDRLVAVAAAAMEELLSPDGGVRGRDVSPAG